MLDSDGSEAYALAFSVVSNLAFVGWGALLLSPLAPIWAQRIGGLVVPAVLSVGYVGLVLVHWSGAPGGFGSLGEVGALMGDRGMLLAGWVHFLAFDLLNRGLDRATGAARGHRFRLGRTLPARDADVRPGGLSVLPRHPGGARQRPGRPLAQRGERRHERPDRHPEHDRAPVARYGARPGTPIASALIASAPRGA